MPQKFFGSSFPVWTGNTVFVGWHVPDLHRQRALDKQAPEVSCLSHFGTLHTAIALWLLSHITLFTPFWQIDIALILLGIGLCSTMELMVLPAQWALLHRHLGVATSTAS